MKTESSVNKYMVTVFWDRKGVILTRYMSWSTTINTDTYCQVLQGLCTAIWHKCSGRQCSFILLLCGNACVHLAIKTWNLLLQFGWTGFEHATYMYISPRPSDYHLFPELKKCLSGQYFAGGTELITFINSFLWKTSEFYNRGICKLIWCYEKCLECQGNYVEN